MRRRTTLGQSLAQVRQLSLEPPFPVGRLHACCVDLPTALVSAARHGVEVLLAGLGLQPDWVFAADLPAGGLYYGNRPEDAPAHAVRLRADPALTAEHSLEIDSAAMSILQWDGRPWPLPMPAGRAFGGPGGGIEEADVVASAHAWTSGRFEAAVVRRDIHGRLRDEDAPTAVVAASRPDLADPTTHPPVDAYRAWLGAALAAAGAEVPGRTWAGRQWALLPSLDVDLLRTRRPSSWLGDDPRRSRMAALVEVLSRDSARATVYLKAGATANYDVEYDLGDGALECVWRNEALEIGLHPSYFAHDHPPRLVNEEARLSVAARAAGREASAAARTHFLRWIEPGTPRALEAAGLSVDSSLGFSARAGFRRGTAVPYRLFDRLAGRPLNVWEVPLAVMDTALWLHARVGREGAAAAIDSVTAGARAAGGAAVLLWHNEPLGAGHVEVLAAALRAASDAGALVDSVTNALANWRPG